MPEDGAAGGALPVRAVQRRGVGVRAPRGRWRNDRGPGRVGGEGRNDILRCHNGRKALAVEELGFESAGP